MTRLILQTLRYFWRQNLNLALGVAVSTAVITGALIVGDSMRYSLERIAALRLGEITHTISAGDRYFTDSLARRLEEVSGFDCAPLLLLDGSAAKPGGQYRLPKVHILGIDENFRRVAGEIPAILSREAYISQSLASRLNLQIRDELLLRIRKLSVVPPNAPFVSDAEPVTSVTVTVTGILADDEMGRFQLQHSQSAPFNVFLNLDFLHELMEAGEQANYVLISATGGGATPILTSALAKAWRLSDLNLDLRRNSLQKAWELTSARVFIDPPIQLALQDHVGSTEFILTYFVNRLALHGRETPYSFVSTLPETELSAGAIILTDWVAEDLQAKTGDSIALDYFVIGPLRQLEERTNSFAVKAVVPMTGRWADESLMPQIPGLSDVGNCRDWQTGVPIDLGRIRKKDEAYWDQYRGAPKAYISYADAQSLWQNRFGASTLIRFPHSELSRTEAKQWLEEAITPTTLGFHVSPVRDEAFRAAAGGVDFSQLFLGLSFFLLLASLLLTVLLFALNTESRMGQIGTLSVLGFTDRQIKAIILLESGSTAAIGAAAGLVLAIGYDHLVFKALNTIWSAIVRTQALTTIIQPATLLIGFAISLFISFLAIYLSLRRLLRQQVHTLQVAILKRQGAWERRLKNGFMYGSGIAAIFLVIWNYVKNTFQDAGLFFAAGGLLLIALLLFLHNQMQRQLPLPAPLRMTTPRLIRQNINRDPNRSFLVVALFAIGTFIVISTGANRRDAFSNAQEKNSGTGGFLFFAESTVPILQNLNDPAVRFEVGLAEEYPVVQIRATQGDDASCLNLNRIANPSVWGVPSEALTGRFQFATRTEELNEVQPWLSLKKPLGTSVIPAVADQTVIQWGLGRKLGDTLEYVDGNGRQLGLKLIGGLSSSIFQGAVLIDEELFLKHFPNRDGTNIFLIDGAPEKAHGIREELELSFRDHGWDMQLAAGRLATFNSVENTYLSIFLILGGLGLIIGAIGLGIVLVRNLLYRRNELGVMLAIGFQKLVMLRIITLEHFYLLILGVGAGITSSAVASLPSWINPHLGFSPWNAILLTGLIFLTGLCWILLSTRWFLQGAKIVEALQEE